MRTYEELTDEQKTEAREIALNSLVGAICAGAVRFNDQLNHDDLQARIDYAIEKAESLQTPWFSGECILETCRDDLEGMATCDAEDAIYLELSEHAVHLSAL